ncbi:YfiR family protein [Methylomonas koyamae]|uniref:YfiR family protein n=1 Tax=Methylomonas koyamae TaxID=702114 RepID=UPI0006D1DFBE|nr:YfiR family protein [Methylomonas koyamae]
MPFALRRRFRTTADGADTEKPGNAPVLTLSDIADFAEKGGGIALLFRDNKVVFEVNLESIRNAGLRLPGQLLNIATHVYGR